MKMFKRKQTFQHKSDQLFHSVLSKSNVPSAMNLIEFRRDKLILNEEAINIIKNIKEEIIIVFIFGKEHTGKSYLMNLLINANESKEKLKESLLSTKNLKGFKVNSSINQNKQERGIFFWNSPINKENSDEKILFIDSDGISTENIYQQTLESKLMALILIISSLFIYNTVGDINSNSLNDLQLIVHLADTISINDKIDKDEMISELCPKFIWTLRDFDIEKYKKIKSKDLYLEQCLKERFITKDEINMINVNLIKYFKKRECIIMPPPLNEEKDFIMLKKKNLSELNEDFQDEFNILKNKIYEQSKSKLIYGQKLTGNSLAFLLDAFIKEINNENIPNIDNIFNGLIKNELDSQFYFIKNLFKEKFDKLKKGENLNIKEIYLIKYDCLNEYMKILEKMPEIYNKENLMKDYQNIEIKLENEINKIIKFDLDTLISENSYEKIIEETNDFFNDDKNNDNKSSKDIIEEYLNNLINIKMDMTDAILNNKNFDSFIKNDIKKTNDVINVLKNIKEENNENIININENIKESDIKSMKLELEIKEKETLDLISKYTSLMEKRDNILKKSIKNNHLKYSIRSYSNKLISSLSSYEEKINKHELTQEREENTEKCNCNISNLNWDMCNIF